VKKTIDFCGLKLKPAASRMNISNGIKEDCYIYNAHNVDICLYVRTNEKHFSFVAYMLDNTIRLGGKSFEDIEKRFKERLNKIIKIQRAVIEVKNKEISKLTKLIDGIKEL